MAPIVRCAFTTVLALAPALAPRDAEAKAAYLGLEQAVEHAERIAIVKAERTSAADIEGEHWHYRQRVEASVIATLKGEASERIEIAAERDFICAPVPYDAPAVYLVFLAHDGAVLATVNHEWGALQVFGAEVQWPYDDTQGNRSLVDAILEVQALVPAAAVLEPARAPTTVESRRPLEDAAPAEEGQLPAPVWIATGALAVLLGLLAATRRSRRR